MTVVFTHPRMCAPGALATWAAMMGERDAISEAAIDAAVELAPSADTGCAVVLAPNLRDFVAVLPGARLRPGADPAVAGYAFVASGDALMIGPESAVDTLSSVASIVEWAGLEAAEALHPDAWASGIGRFDVGDPVIGGDAPSRDTISFSVSERAVVFQLDGEPDAVRSSAKFVDDYLARLTEPSSDPAEPGDVSEDAARMFARSVGLAKAVAEGRVSSEVSERRYRGTLALEAGGDIKLAALTGMIAALFAPTMMKFHRRRRTLEPRVELARLFDAILATMYGDPADHHDFRGCPGSVPEGEAGFTPPLGHACAGPAETCMPALSGAGSYDPGLWTDNPTWRQLGFSEKRPHRFHYNVRWRYDERADGCQFTAQAFGDLDDDGVFSTFERAAAADEHGVNTLGLYIDQEIE